MGLKYLEDFYGKKYLDRQKKFLDRMDEKKGVPYFLVGEDEGAKIRQLQFDKYLEVAFRHEIVDNNLRRRLKSSDWAVFQQAHQELMCAYFFEQILGFEIQFYPSGNKNSIGDFLAVTSTKEMIFVEIKTVIRESPAGIWLGDDRDVIKKNVKRARKQMKSDEDIYNLVVISGKLRDSISSTGSGIFEALYGEPYLTFPVGPGVKDVEFQEKIKTSGEFQPKANTRISAVATLEDVINCPYLDSIFAHIDSNKKLPIDESLPKHVFKFMFLVYHNPYAKKPLEKNIFSKYPQHIFNESRGTLEWLNPNNITKSKA